MARGKRTDPTAAVLVKIMAEMGFEQALIAEIVGLKRSTVNDIIRGHGPWQEMPETELTQRTRQRVKSAIESYRYERPGGRHGSPPAVSKKTYEVAAKILHLAYPFYWPKPNAKRVSNFYHSA